MEQRRHSGFMLIVLSTVLIVLFISLGFLAAVLIDANSALNIESPFALSKSAALAAPSDVLTPSNIEVQPDRVVIRLSGVSLSSYAPTGSMQPVLNEHANGLRIIPQSEGDIHVGDIVSFERAGTLVVHRVIEKGIDDAGTYFITQGDNAQTPDAPIRFGDIQFKTIAILY